MQSIDLSKIQSYKNVTESLLERTQKAALFIEEICQENGISQILGDKYRLRSYTSSSCSYCDLELRVSVSDYWEEDIHVALANDTIDANRDRYLRNGDLNAGYFMPNRDDIKTFIADLPAIFADIEKQMDVNTAQLDAVLSAIKSA